MYKTEHEFCMDLWRDMVGLPPARRRILPDLDELRKTEWVPLFELMMRNRIIMAGFRYETFADKRKRQPNYKYAEEAIRKIAHYLITGDMEDLVDTANYCMLEFEFGHRDNKHLKAKDDSEHAHYLGDLKNAST